MLLYFLILLLFRISIYFEIRFKFIYRVDECNNQSTIAEKAKAI